MRTATSPGDVFATVRNRVAHHTPYLIQQDLDEMCELVDCSAKKDEQPAQVYYKFFNMVAMFVKQMADQVA